MDYRQVLQTGTVLDGKYRIERVIGSGGFGITYEAFDIGLAAPVAIKEYYPSQFGIRDATHSVRPRTEHDREIFDRLLASFLREARTLNQFEHPAIVRVISVFEGYGTAYMVMKYETGPSLKAWLADLVRLPTQSELDRLVLPLLDSLEMMHNAEFLHRDIAPDNIIVRADGSPVLLDFGASRRVMGEMTGTLTGVVKKGYSPQEQYATDSRSQGPWTDIYALGATLYRCISGETPYEATERMLDDHVSPAVEAGAGRYRHAFLAAIDAAMVLRPKQRPQSIAVWREMLFEGALPPPGQPQSWPTIPRAGSADAAAGGAESRHWDAAASSGSQPRSGPRSTPSLREGGASPYDARSEPSGSGLRSVPPNGFGASDEGPQSGSNPSLPHAAPPRRNMVAVAIVAGAVAIIGGGGLVLGLSRSGAPVAPVQTALDDQASRVKADDEQRRAAQAAAEEAQRRQNERLERLEREAAAMRAAEEARQRQQAEDARQRQQAEEAETRRRAEEEKRRAAEDARQRQLAEEARQRQQAEDARQRQQVEEARQRQLAEEANQRRIAEEAEIRRRTDAERQRVAALELQQQRDRERAQREEAARRQAEDERRRLAARPRQLAYAAPGSVASFPVAVQTNPGLIVAGGSDGGLKAWDSATGAPREFRGARHSDAISSVAVSPDGQQVVSGAWGGEVILWSLTGTAQRFRAADAGDGKASGRRWVVATAFVSPTRFISVLSDGTAQTWDTRTPGKAVAEVRLDAAGIKAADVSRNGATLATGTDSGGIALFRASDGQAIRHLPGHRDWVLALAFAGSADLLGSGSADGVVRILNTANASLPLVREIQAHDTAVRAITFSADGMRFATGGDDGTVNVWDAASGSMLATYKDHRTSVRSLTLSADGQRLVSASEDGDVRVWYLDAIVQVAAPGATNPQR